MRMTCKVRRPDLMLEDQDEQKLLSVTCRVRTKRIRQKNTLKKYKSTNNCLTNYKKKKRPGFMVKVVLMFIGYLGGGITRRRH